MYKMNIAMCNIGIINAAFHSCQLLPFQTFPPLGGIDYSATYVLMTSHIDNDVTVVQPLIAELYGR